MLTFRRLLACAFLTSALSISVAACSDDDEGDGGDNTEEPDADTGGADIDGGTADEADACVGHFC